MKQYPKWLTVEQAAEYMQLDPETIRRWIRSGRLQAVKIGRSYRIDKDVIDQLMEGKRA